LAAANAKIKRLRALLDAQNTLFSNNTLSNKRLVDVLEAIA
jgi:hypothetical protein